MAKCTACNPHKGVAITQLRPMVTRQEWGCVTTAANMLREIVIGAFRHNTVFNVFILNSVLVVQKS